MGHISSGRQPYSSREINHRVGTYFIPRCESLQRGLVYVLASLLYISRWFSVSAGSPDAPCLCSRIHGILFFMRCFLYNWLFPCIWSCVFSGLHSPESRLGRVLLLIRVDAPILQLHEAGEGICWHRKFLQLANLTSDTNSLACADVRLRLLERKRLMASQRLENLVLPDSFGLVARLIYE
jgi:hypothetical protein